LRSSEIIEAAGVGAAGFALATELRPETILAQTATSSERAKPMTYDIKPLPFDPTRIKGMSEKLLVSHYGEPRKRNSCASAEYSTFTSVTSALTCSSAIATPSRSIAAFRFGQSPNVSN
jgi:hypothetical protein